MEWIKQIRLPGAVWSAIIIAAMGFLTTNFEHAGWYGLAMALLLAVAKYYNLNVEEKNETDAAMARTLKPVSASQNGPSKLSKWLWG